MSDWTQDTRNRLEIAVDSSRPGQLRESISAALAEIERLKAFASGGHADDCGGMDEPNRRCGCGWLQGEGAHKYILDLEAALDRRAERIAEQRAEIQKLRAALGRSDD